MNPTSFSQKQLEIPPEERTPADHLPQKMRGVESVPNLSPHDKYKKTIEDMVHKVQDLRVLDSIIPISKKRKLTSIIDDTPIMFLIAIDTYEKIKLTKEAMAFFDAILIFDNSCMEKEFSSMKKYFKGDNAIPKTNIVATLIRKTAQNTPNEIWKKMTVENKHEYIQYTFKLALRIVELFYEEPLDAEGIVAIEKNCRNLMQIKSLDSDHWTAKKYLILLDYVTHADRNHLHDIIPIYVEEVIVPKYHSRIEEFEKKYFEKEFNTDFEAFTPNNAFAVIEGYADPGYDCLEWCLLDNYLGHLPNPPGLIEFALSSTTPLNELDLHLKKIGFIPHNTERANETGALVVRAKFDKNMPEIFHLHYTRCVAPGVWSSKRGETPLIQFVNPDFETPLSGSIIGVYFREECSTLETEKTENLFGFPVFRRELNKPADFDKDEYYYDLLEELSLSDDGYNSDLQTDASDSESVA